MQIASPAADTGLAARHLRLAWIFWGVFCLAAATFLVLDTNRHPVNESYAHGARCWQRREPLYKGCGTGFIYLPHSAILHAPFLALPHRAYEFAWRITTIGLFAAGVYRLAQCSADCLRGAESPGARQYSGAAASPGITTGLLFLLMTLITLPKTWTVAVNGQATPAMAGLMMLAVADIGERRWWRGAGALLLALAFKPLAIVLILLAGALWFPLAWRLAAGAVLFLAFPYLTAGADYASAQSLAFLRNLNAASALGQQQQMIWPQLFSLLDLIGTGLPIACQFPVQLLAALATFVAARQVSRRFPAGQSALFLYSLAASYLLLFNPRTENNSYTLLMPAVAAFALRAAIVEKSVPRTLLLGGIAVCLTGGFEISGLVTPKADFVWPCPLACLAFLAFVGGDIARNRVWERFPLTDSPAGIIQPAGIDRPIPVKAA